MPIGHCRPGANPYPANDQVADTFYFPPQNPGDTRHQFSLTLPSDGWITVSIQARSGWANSFIYNWSNGATTEDLSGLAPGTYAVTVSDDHLCEDSATATIANVPPLGGTLTPTDPPALTVHVAKQDAGRNDGADRPIPAGKQRLSHTRPGRWPTHLLPAALSPIPYGPDRSRLTQCA